MKDVLYLIRHHYKMEIRSSQGIAGLVLFAIASVYTGFQVVGGNPDPDTWNALAWIILMFTSFNSASRPLPEDLASVRTYLHWVVSPRKLIIARTIHHSLILIILASLLLFAMGLFLGTAELCILSIFAFLLGMIFTGVALASTLTLLAAISARAGAGYGLTAILGLPLIIPIILVSTQFGSDLLSGLTLAQSSDNLIFLLTLATGSSIFGYVLFPYLWRT
jgi:heme exporter protein B